MILEAQITSTNKSVESRVRLLIRNQFLAKMLLLTVDDKFI